MARDIRERRDDGSNLLRLVVTLLVLGGAYLGLSYWSATHLPSSVRVGGVPIGGLTPEQARAALDAASASVLRTPIDVAIPGADRSFAVDPAKAGFAVDAARSVEGLTGLSLDPRTLWERLSGSVDAALLTRTDDDVLTAYLTALAPSVNVPAKEGGVSFPEGKLTIDLPRAGHLLDVPGTKLALRRAFPDAATAVAAVTEVQPRLSAEAVQRAAADFGMRAMSGPVLLVSGGTSTPLWPNEFAPALSMAPDGRGGLVPTFDEALLGRLVADKVEVPTRPARSARWTFAAGNGAPTLVPSVEGTAVDAAAIPGQVAAAISSTDRTVTIRTVPTTAPVTTEDATKAGVREVVAEFTSPFPPEDTTRTRNLVVATQAINGTYIAPGATFSLNGILGERTTEKGYGDGTVIIDGRLTRGTGGGISQVSTTIYNLAYFAGADLLEFTPHAFFIPRYPEGREATVFWPTVDNTWRNGTPYGMLLQTWVADGSVHGRVWSTKTWDVRSVKGPRRNVVTPRTIRDESPTCYPQQPQPGFDVTVTRQLYRPGSATLVRSEPHTSHYIPEHRVICTDPTAKP